MKTLPDNPNLDHLRRQAKDLLAGLRDSDPNASLSDAQASLAAQYGFRTWTDLKAEVDRMRGKVDVADPALARQIATRFGLGEVTGSMRSVSRSDEIGRRWTLETERGRWAPRTVDNVFPVTDGEENLRFQEAAARASVRLPAPVRSRTGAAVETIEGNRWRVYQWLHAGPPLAAPVSATVTREVGDVLATMHAMRFPADDICPWNAGLLSTTSWARLAQVAADTGAAWAAVLGSAVPTLVGLESIGDAAATTEPVMCHNNFNPGNVRRGDRLIVVGWEHASGLPPEWELSAALANWAVDPGGGVNAVGVRALVDGYRARAGALPPLCLDSFRGHATGLLNYVAGEVDVALHADTADEQRYADRNVRHLLTHVPSRTTYEQILAAAFGRRRPTPSG